MADTILDLWDKLREKYPGLPEHLKPFQADAVRLVREGFGVVLAVPTGAGKTQPMVAASLGTGAVGIAILPLISLEQQMERDLTRLNIPFINLSNTRADKLEQQLQTVKPELLLTSVESLADREKRDALRRSRVEVGHISWDEAMVMHEVEGWQGFRAGYGTDMFRYLAATYPKAPWILASATLDDDCINSIVESLGTRRDRFKVLYMDCNRGNIYHQERRISKALKIGNIDRELAFLLPLMAGSAKLKIQIFVVEKDTEDLIASWLRIKCQDLQFFVMTKPEEIAKLSGDNSREEKKRVMEGFISGQFQVLVCTDCAGMGVHVPGLNCVVNIGLPRNMWKVGQQAGRAGRDSGSKAACVTVHWPGQKGKSTPAARVRTVFGNRDECLRLRLNSAFKLSNTYEEYVGEPGETKVCLELGCSTSVACRCMDCLCCSVCSARCDCVGATEDPDTALQRLLRPNYCYSYQGVRLMAEKMTALDDKEWTSSEEEKSASSSEDELHELY